MSDPQQLREKIARTIAIEGDEDGCFLRVDEWEATEQWEKDAHPQEEPFSDREDCAYWLRKAAALLPLVLGEKREAWDEGLSAGYAMYRAKTTSIVSNPYLPAGDHTENEGEKL